MSTFPTSLDAFGNPAGTTLLADPAYLHNQQHSDVNDATEALEAKVGLGAGTPIVNNILVGNWNGTATWGTVWNGATLGSVTVNGGTATNFTMTSGSLGTAVLGLSGGPFVTVGTANADYITDGTADQVQIQAAIDAVNTAGGGVVFIKTGTYSIDPTTSTGSSTIAEAWGYPKYGLIMKSNVTVLGDGMGNTIFTTGAIPAVTGGYFTLFTSLAVGVTNISLRDFSITLPAFLGGISGYNDNGFLFAGCTNSVFRDLYFTNGGWAIAGVTYAFDSATKEFTSDAKNILIDNVTTDGILGSNSFFYVTDTTVQHCKVYNNHDDAFLIASAGQRIVVDNCIFDGQNNTVLGGGSNGTVYILNDLGVSSDAAVLSDIKITNNTIRRVNLVGFPCAGITMARCKDILIQGNEIEQCGYGLYNNGGVNIENLTVIGNNIHDNRAQGVSFEDASAFGLKNFIFTNNRVYNNVGDGVLIQDGRAGTLMNGLTIEGNSFYDNQGTQTQTHGVNIGAVGGSVVATNILYVGNNTYGGTMTDLINYSSGGTITNLKIRSNTGISDN